MYDSDKKTEMMKLVHKYEKEKRKDAVKRRMKDLEVYEERTKIILARQVEEKLEKNVRADQSRVRD